LPLAIKRQPTAAFFCVSAEDDAIIARFWTPSGLEDGLSEKTREAYRSDPESAWLSGFQGSPGHTVSDRPRVVDLLAGLSADGERESLYGKHDGCLQFAAFTVFAPRRFDNRKTQPYAIDV